MSATAGISLLPARFRRRAEDLESAEALDFLCAIWILACNDENCHISYAGLEYRLRPPADLDVRALVGSRGELFRLRMPESRLAAWKERVRKNPQKPSWIRAIPEGPERNAVIDALGPDDFFRSQFRAENDAPKSPIEIVDWGLKHVERLRKARTEEREERHRRFATFVLPALTISVSVLAILISAWTQWRLSDDQRSLKQYEITLRPKQEGYVSFMKHFWTALDSGMRGNKRGALRALDSTQLASVQLEPFLPPQTRDHVRSDVEKAYGLTVRMIAPGVTQQSSTAFNLDSAIALRTHVKEELYAALFARQ